MRRLQNEVDQVLDRGAAVRAFPLINLYAGDEGVIATAEIPGVSPENLNITVEGDLLTLSGSRPVEEGDSLTYHRRERVVGEFSRTVQLPFRVNAEKVEANFRNGVLHITLPRLEEDKPRKISVKTP
ncbi:MAG: Hsp20/alpha crystallin family protein [Chloroflexi bacterium]|nr:Hsp20/alpha crystallin family protein [Chloroflexota bacterium]MCI0577614.1 Hsp20/alpha crystallin family protein [Chloroflexota bacterium]MCI0644166.1 Hsp20/alpha crystallin family protein [Chloroflexota bacterium]MCI0725251.1 Hsp20/alpha crystallin family protein [Chloroflexota bacterium]